MASCEFCQSLNPALPCKQGLPQSRDLEHVLALQLPATHDLHLRVRHAVVGAVGLERPHHVLALDHLPEDHVLPVQPGRLLSGDEELRPVGVRSRGLHWLVLLWGLQLAGNDRVSVLVRSRQDNFSGRTDLPLRSHDIWALSRERSEHLVCGMTV